MGNMSVSLSGDDEDGLRGYWNKLIDGGTAAMPLEKAPWGDSFGRCVARFGVTWMINIAGSAAQVPVARRGLTRPPAAVSV